uniref:DUF4802 domain-containing protein n=1 Tax=Anopheles maculatus TaxID=74869 RepID=A0A182SGN6_9DIPT
MKLSHDSNSPTRSQPITTNSQSQYFDCDDDADAYSEYSDKSYDLEDNLYTNRSYYNDLSTIQPAVPDADTFGSTDAAAINDRLNRNRSAHNRAWAMEEPELPADDVVNGNECQHYLHSTHNPSSLNLSLDEGQPPANDRSQLPIDTSDDGRRSPAAPEVTSDEETLALEANEDATFSATVKEEESIVLVTVDGFSCTNTSGSQCTCSGC